jgi:hypothetical protein
MTVTIERLYQIAESRGVDIQFAEDYCEPGYTLSHEGRGVLFANWNDRRITQHQTIEEVESLAEASAMHQNILTWPKWQRGRNVEIGTDTTAPRLAKIFEKQGYEIEWSDEWSVCPDCNKAFRTSGDSYHWQPHFATIDDCECICGDCIKSDPKEYLESLADDWCKCETLGIDLSQWGYVEHQVDQETGFHPGQTADPEKLLEAYRESGGMGRVIFQLDSTGQFDAEWSMWVERSERIEGRAEVKGPGKFEGGELYAPYFYSMWGNGFAADEVRDPGVFVVSDGDKALFPELRGYNTIHISEDSQGFVYCSAR